MKTPEDEAFDDLAKKQGDWGGGFKAKQAMAADKLQEDLINYGTSWSQDGKRIDPMSVYKEPVTEREALKLALEALEEHDYGVAQIIIREALAQPAPQREWVGLIKEDYVLVNQLCIDPLDAAELVNRLLKERNHGT